jgi:2-keto-3-deoxy-6-phosphogluconate aldolase
VAKSPFTVITAPGPRLDKLVCNKRTASSGRTRLCALKALAGPFPTVRFCPTGGIDARSASDYLALPNVVAIGGSWLTPASAIARQDWAAVTTLARGAAALTRGDLR